jgi:hypothetical protein
LRAAAEEKMPFWKLMSKPRKTQAAFDYVPKSRAEYRSSQTDKDRLRKMVGKGCDYDEIAEQIGRTAAACKAMYNLLTKKKT